MSHYPHAHSTIKPPTSAGTCFICNEKIAGDSIEGHLQSCLPSLHWQEEKDPSLLIRITDKYQKKFWLLVLASPKATLKDLDSFIRDVWVECCGHLSDFTIGHVHFSRDGEDEDMYVYIRDVLQPGEESVYQYDFGSTTTLVVRVLGTVPVVPPGRCIVLLGQNRRTHHACRSCDKEADYVYREDWTGRPQYFCSDCLSDQSIDNEYCLYLSNSPRAGVCGCMKGDEDGVSWYPRAKGSKPCTSTSKKKVVRRFNREDLNNQDRDPVSALIARLEKAARGMEKKPKNMIVKPAKTIRINSSPFPQTIPDAIAGRHKQVHDLCVQFCNEHPELDMEKPVLDLLSLIARIPLTMNILNKGTEHAWASGFIYAIGQMKGLFTRGREEGLKSKDIGNYFGVKGVLAQSRAYHIRTELRKVKGAWEVKYKGTLFDYEVDTDWAELMNEWV